MGIRFICPSCDKKLNVKAYLAGKRGICPECEARIRIPMDSETEHLETSFAGDKRRSAMSIAKCVAERPELKWYVRPADGGEFGPASGEVLLAWIEEKRIDHRTHLRRHDWINWQPASKIFSEFQQSIHRPPRVNLVSKSEDAQSVLEPESQVAVLAPPSESPNILDATPASSNDDNFFEALETNAVEIETNYTFANLQVDQSTLAHHNIRRSDSSGNKMKGVVLAFLSVVLLGSLVAVVVLSQ